MSAQYFLNFPALNYAGYAATNIMERVAFAQRFKDNFKLFYDYDIPDGRKAEHIAQDLYGAPEYVWMIYLFNDIIDPYYQWPLSTVQFNQMIIDKYGSFGGAGSQTVYYQNNWTSDERKLDTAGYAALPAAVKKYWRPYLKPGNIVDFYVRAPNDTRLAITTTIAGAEAVYYTAVTALEKELEDNINKSRIKLVKQSFLPAIEQSFKDAFQ